MMFRPWHFTARITLVSGLLGLFGQGAFAADAEKPASAPSPSTKASPAAESPARKKDGLKEWERDLNRSLKPHSFRESLDDMLELPMPQRAPIGNVIQNSRTKEMNERRRNWMNLSAEEMLLGSPDNNYFSSENNKRSGSDKKSPLEKFYDDLNHNRGKDDHTGARKDKSKTNGFDNPADDDAAENDPTLPLAVREREKEIKKNMGDIRRDPSGTKTTRSVLSDMFNPTPESGPTRAEVLAHKAYMQKYQELLTGPGQAPVSALNPLTPLGTPGTPGANNFSHLYDGLDAMKRTPQVAPAATTAVNPALNSTISDINARALNQWNPYYQPPAVDQPKPKPLTVPVTDVQRRKF